MTDDLKDLILDEPMTIEQVANMPYHGITHKWLLKRGWSYDRTSDTYFKGDVTGKHHESLDIELEALNREQPSIPTQEIP